MWRNRIILFLCVLATGVMASHRGGRVSYALFSFALLLPISSLLYTLYVYLRFRIYQTIEAKTVIKGDWIPYVFTLANEDFITYTNVRVAFFEGGSTVRELDFSKDYCLLPGQSSNQTTSLRCHYRGEYDVGVQSVIVTDYLRLFSIRYRLYSHLRMVVHPKVVVLLNPVFTLPEEDEKNPSYAWGGTDGLMDSESRDYMPGDPIKRIHWKATARLGKTMARKTTPFTRSETLFFLDVVKPKGDPLTKLKVEDKLLECALAIVHFFAHSGTAVKLFADSPVHGMVVTNADSFETFYDYCKGMSFTGNVAIGKLLAHHLPYLSSHRRILCITHRIDPALPFACHQALGKGVDVSVVYIGDDADSATHQLDERVSLFPMHSTQETEEGLERAKA